MSVTAKAVLFLFFGFTPEGVQFIEGAILNGPQGFAQCLFDKTKAPFDLGVGRAQGAFGVDFEHPCICNSTSARYKPMPLRGSVFVGIFAIFMYNASAARVSASVPLLQLNE